MDKKLELAALAGPRIRVNEKSITKELRDTFLPTCHSRCSTVACAGSLNENRPVTNEPTRPTNARKRLALMNL